MPAILRGGFTYYMHDGAEAFRLQLSGDLSRESAGDMVQACETAASVFGGRSLIVDITAINSVDVQSRRLLEEWHVRGARLVVMSARAKARIQPMIDAPIRVMSEKAHSSEWLRGRAALWLAGLLAAGVLAAAVAL